MTSTTPKIKDSIVNGMYFNDFDIEDSCFSCQHNDFREAMIIIICLRLSLEWNAQNYFDEDTDFYDFKKTLLLVGC